MSEWASEWASVVRETHVSTLAVGVGDAGPEDPPSSRSLDNL